LRDFESFSLVALQAAEKVLRLSFRSRRTFSVNRGALFAEESLFYWT
jgi:hypothetical protein